MIPDEKKSLLLVTIKLLKESTFNLFEISEKTSLNYYWLKKLYYNKLKDPSVNKIQILYEFLSDKKIVDI